MTYLAWTADKSHDLNHVAQGLLLGSGGQTIVLVTFLLALSVAGSRLLRGQAGGAIGVLLISLLPAWFIFDPQGATTCLKDAFGSVSGVNAPGLVITGAVVLGGFFIVVTIVVCVYEGPNDAADTAALPVEKKPASGPPLPLTRWNGSPILASGAERERIVGLLRAADLDDRFDVDELDRRVGRAYAAKTRAELVSLVTDLPPEDE